MLKKNDKRKNPERKEDGIQLQTKKMDGNHLEVIRQDQGPQPED